MNEFFAVPHLTTALKGSFQKLERIMLNNQVSIESWFRNSWPDTKIPFYASVDLRNAGYKISPIDTNLFPAGFNNLNPVFESLSIHAVQVAIEHLGTPIDKILIVAENHTRNLFYLENIYRLQLIIKKAGFETRVCSLDKDLQSPTEISLPSGNFVLLEPVKKQNGRVLLNGFDPDLILLNNDLSSGKPDILNNIEQKITPPTNMGWFSRLKSQYFTYYRQVAKEFADIIDIDPWLIDPMFRNCGEINFMKHEGIDCLSKNTNFLIEAIKNKYAEYNIKDEPFIIIKSDSGTYGMGVMTVQNADEISKLNRKERTRMAKTKGGEKVSKVIIQEGVYTNERWNNEESVAEPVIYMIDHQVVGGFYRVHEKRSARQNLNAPGMRFEQLAFEDCCISPEPELETDCHQNRFYTYGVIARLALLAAAREIRDAI